MADLTPTLCIVTALSVLCLPQAGAVEVHHTLIQAEVVQTYGELGEFMFQLDDDEIFYVHSPKKDVVWKLPDFQQFTSFEGQGALGNLALDKSNLGILKKSSNNTAAKNVAPEVLVFSEDTVEIGEPNVLICFMNRFFPPVINVTWLKNGQRVTEGVAETDFYPNDDFSFRKYLYLTFIPTQEDEYACSVDHWGQEATVNKFWDSNLSTPPSEVAANVLCGLGLAVGIVGIIAGTILCIKAVRLGNGAGRGL
ncbi:H-2 class II histocompatibility antigen, E-U alpha chain-like [Ambystoma mexicanum]|uniref:H-2 class II histocompatibility antigen, E-U alpha chain-like n=1 Tax=Ambystoma mexicanum TaxID=8296 RepID=UPI0037E93ABE